LLKDSNLLLKVIYKLVLGSPVAEQINNQRCCQNMKHLSTFHIMTLSKFNVYIHIFSI